MLWYLKATSSNQKIVVLELTKTKIPFSLFDESQNRDNMLRHILICKKYTVPAS